MKFKSLGFFRLFLYVFALAPWLVCSAPLVAQSEIKSTHYETLSEFELVDFRGEKWRFLDAQDSRILVVAFLGTECPLAKLYSLRLQELNELYSDKGVKFIAIDPNLQDSLEEMAAFARRQGFAIPFFKDANGAVAKTFGATRTPEVFVLNSQRAICYQGRIDDQFGIGYARDKPLETELQDALESLLFEKPVRVPKSEAVGCIIGHQKQSAEDPEFTYASNVASILNQHCVACHRAGQIGPFVLDNYDDASAWGEMIAEVVTERRMPPWSANSEYGQFANDCSLNAEERNILLRWVEQGTPLGNAQDIPAVPEFTPGWQLADVPDFVCNVTEKPVDIPATGDVRYKYFTYDPNFSEDKWISMAELRPGNLKVVHHILCFVVPREAKELEQELDGFLVGYVPGMLPVSPREGYAKKIPKDSKLVFQVHYTPNGRATTDQSQLGLKFVDVADVTHEIITTCAVNPKFEIPPNDPAFAVEAWNRQKLKAWEVVSMMPHMHLRGSAFRYEAFYPDGKREILLDVPHYDFNWQTSYQLAVPKALPAGTRIHCQAVFDNSLNNLNNPDPTKKVAWGDQTWEEMMIGYFDIAVPKAEAARIHR